MATSPTDPAVLLAVTAGGIGVFLLVQARIQSRLLRHRIAAGTGTVAVDPRTGLWSAAAAHQCVRAEASRALRLGRPLDVWVGRAPDARQIDEHGRALALDLPPGSMAIRIDRTHVCVLSCAGAGDAPQRAAGELRWRSTSIEPGEDAATDVLTFISAEVHDRGA